MLKYTFLIFILNFSAWSADLYLFNSDDSFNDSYRENIFSGDLKAGENIHLKNKVVTFKEILGSGNTTLILNVYDEGLQRNLALRLPHGNEEKQYTLYDGKKFINYSYEGYSELNETDLSIPKIHEYEKSSYLLVDLIKNDFDLKEYFNHIETITSDQKVLVENALIEFAKESAIYQSIGDFHNEQLVYSMSKRKWFLLDWSSGHTLARQPSSPVLFTDHFFTNSKRAISDYERELMIRLNEAISAERTKQIGLDNIEIEKIKSKLSELSSHEEVLKVYSSLKGRHMMSFYTLLQKDFITNHLSKFPTGKIKKKELVILLNNLGKFSPFYFSQFTEKVMANIYDLESFMFIYKKMNEIGLDEELEDDISFIIADNMQRILSNTKHSEEALTTIEKLKSDYGLISYQTKDILEKASEFLIPARSCNQVLSEILNN
ncbi:hypothetical protein ACRXCV_07020 [Halobacteriovorax sp. GFR7]|uniref:hypothetical protein n=1 Tax=unclassified Halobacteriovorax TaxID=2639665 RepID=UPI003D97F973